MKDIKEVYQRLQIKKKERNELGKMMRDALSHNDEYRELIEELKKMREKKKSIENQVKRDSLTDIAQMDVLKLEISASSELLSDIALTMYTNHETVEIVDEERGVRLTPIFSVKFQKENLDSEEVKAATQRAESHPERQFAGAR